MTNWVMKKPVFPIEVKRGSAIVKIYKTHCRGKTRYTTAYWLNATRKRQTFDDLDRAKTAAAIAATQMTAGDLELTSADRAAHLRARQLLDPVGLGIEWAAAQMADAVQRLSGVSVSQALDFYVRHHQGIITTRTVPEVAAELLAAKRSDRLSPRYLKQLEYDLNRFGTKFPGRIGDVPGVAMDGWLRGLELSPRTRNNHLAVSISHNAKGKALVKALAIAFAKARELGAAEKAIIFTESRKTQSYLLRVLADTLQCTRLQKY